MHSELKEDFNMLYLILFVVGFVTALVCTARPIKIEIHHKNENIIPQLPETTVPKMSEVVTPQDAEEDKVYEDMGKLIGNINEIFGGSDRV